MIRRGIGDVYNPETAQLYTKLYEQEKTEDAISESEHFFREQLPTSLAGKEILDLGAGNGKNAEMLLKKGANHVTAIELSDAMIAQAEARKEEHGLDNLEVLQGDLNELNLPVESIDFVFSRFSVMYAQDLPKLCNELAKALKDNGEILIQANVATFTSSEAEEQIKDTPVPIVLQLGDTKVDIKNYANSYEDYLSAFASAGLTVEVEQTFDAEELSVSDSFEHKDDLSLQYVVFKLTKHTK